MANTLSNKQIQTKDPRPCPRCVGKKTIMVGDETKNCPACGGSGRNGLVTKNLLFLLFVIASLAAPVAANAIEPPAPKLSLDLPSEMRMWYRNPDGSCVQCSIGMCGVDQNVPAAATLLWDTEYGHRERGGSGPSRVSRYCASRGIKAWNITGESTFDWMKWAVRNGRGAAIGAGSSHFQTLAGYDSRAGIWYVCNNNSPKRIDEYSESAFRRLHLASGRWVVVLDYPPHPVRPRYVRWW